MIFTISDFALMSTCVLVHVPTVELVIESGHGAVSSAIIEFDESLAETGPIEVHIMRTFTGFET